MFHPAAIIIGSGLGLQTFIFPPAEINFLAKRRNGMLKSLKIQ